MKPKLSLQRTKDNAIIKDQKARSCFCNDMGVSNPLKISQNSEFITQNLESISCFCKVMKVSNPPKTFRQGRAFVPITLIDKLGEQEG